MPVNQEICRKFYEELFLNNHVLGDLHYRKVQVIAERILNQDNVSLFVAENLEIQENVKKNHKHIVDEAMPLQALARLLLDRTLPHSM